MSIHARASAFDAPRRVRDALALAATQRAAVGLVAHSEDEFKALKAEVAKLPEPARARLYLRRRALPMATA